MHFDIISEITDIETTAVESQIRECQGASEAIWAPYGCEDMCGSVWEWTRSLRGKNWQKPDFVYPYDPDDRKREDLSSGNRSTVR